MQRDDLVAYLDDLLMIGDIPDYGPQGLQVEGRAEVRRIAAVVDTAAPSVAAADAWGADLLLVHHGIFWGEARPLTGGFGRLLRQLAQSDLNLYAAHLALDAHPELGNNAVLARRLGLEPLEWWGRAKGTPVALLAAAAEPLTLDGLVAAYTRVLGPPLLVQPHGPALIRRLGLCSGGGAGFVAEARRQGCDAYLTGETSHAHYYEALAEGLHVIYGGHYATETLGLEALGQHLAERFGLDFELLDLPTGV